MRSKRRRRRRGSGVEEEVGALVTRIEKQFDGTPLSVVGDRLLRVLHSLPEGISRKQWEPVKQTFQAIIQRLPEEVGPRFYFDSHLLQQVKDSWQRGPAILPGTVIPVYRGKWQYEPVRMPGMRRQDQRVHCLYLIGIEEGKGQRVDTPPFLLDYSFLCHELAHNLVQKNEDPLVERIEDTLKEVLREQARRRMPFRGQAKSRSESRSNEIEQHWSIQHQGMWAFELAIDVIALRTCGPAYLDTLTHYLREHYDEKFQIEPSHPPAALRGEVLLRTARRLEWSNYAGELRSLINDWTRQRPPSFNRYQSLTDDQIVGGCLDAASDYCEEMNLPHLTQDDLSRIGSQIEENRELVGTDLIVGAWIVDQRRDEAEYSQWEQKIFRDFVEDLHEGSEMSS